MRSFLFPVLIGLFLNSTSWGQLPSTHLNTVFPPGGKQGATVAITATGSNIDMADQMVFSHPGITATPKTAAPNEFLDPAPVAGNFEVKIAADVPPGVYEARLSGEYGVSNPRAFVVGALEEVADNNANKSKETAQEVAIGAVICGKVDANVSDNYKVNLKQGQRVLAECLASRIDSRMDPVLTIHGDAGVQLAQSHDYDGLDAFLDFTAPQDGDYVFAVRDFLFTGGAEHFYRLAVHSNPHVDYVTPNSVAAGQTADVTVYGRNLPGGKPSQVTAADGATLEQLQIKVTAPADAVPGGKASAALQSSSLLAFEHHQPNISFTLYVARSPSVIVEPAENETPDKAAPISVPVEVAGQFYPANDTDWYQFEAKKSDVFWIEVISHRLGLDTDANLIVQRVDKNDKGEETVKEVAFVDDPGNRAGSVATDFDTSTDDPSYKLTVAADGIYRVRVSDQFGGTRNDPRMQYRLVIRRENPDVRVTAIVKEFKVVNNNAVPVFAPRIRKGGAIPVDIRVERLDGYTGPVTITAAGLPASIRCPAVTIDEGQTAATIIFVAADNAEPWMGRVDLKAEITLNDKPVQRPVAMGTVVWGTTNRTQIPATFRLVRDFLLSVIAEDTPATVTVGDETILETSLGGKLELPIKVARHGHTEDLKLTAVNAPKEFKPADVTVKKDQGEGKLAIDIKAGSKPGLYNFYLRSDTKIKYAAKTQLVTIAENNQKKLDEVVKKLAAEVKQHTDTVNKAKAAATAAKAEMTKADAATKAAQTAEQQAKQKADAAKQAVAKAEEAAKAKADDANLAKAVETAKQQATQMDAAVAEAAKALATAIEQAAQAKAKADEMAKAQADGEKTLKDTQARSTRAVAAKKAIDTAVTNAKKAAAAKDVNIAVYSSPIQIRVVQSPLTISAQADAELKPEGKVSLPLKIEKKFGFDEVLDVTVTLPKGVGGITPGKLQIAKGAGEGALELTANAKPTAGEHTIKIVAKGKFNNVPVEASTDVKVKIPAP